MNAHPIRRTTDLVAGRGGSRTEWKLALREFAMLSLWMGTLFAVLVFVYGLAVGPGPV